MAAQPPTPAQIASLASDLEEWSLREGKLHRLRLHGPRGPSGRGDGSSPRMVQGLEPGHDQPHDCDIGGLSPLDLELARRIDALLH